MTEHRLQWTSPPPFWFEAADAKALSRPAILRFATDSFMDEFTSALESDPLQLNELVARAETWRGPAPSPKKESPVQSSRLSALARKLMRLRVSERAIVPTAPAASAISVQTGSGKMEPLKLYQPAHQRYYLVTACLVCGTAGFPDRRLNTGVNERASFVVRRRFPRGGPDVKKSLPLFDDTWEEYAFISGKGWQKVATAEKLGEDSLIHGEEEMPLFPVNYTEDDGRRRRLFAGLVPVSKREVYMGAGQYAQPSDKKTEGEESAKPAINPRMVLFNAQVAEPWKRLLERADEMNKKLQDETDTEIKKDVPKREREQIQTVSWYILLDFANFLEKSLPDVWDALKKGEGLHDENGKKLIDALASVKVSEDNINKLIGPIYTKNKVLSSLLEALKYIADWRDKLEAATKSYDRENPDPNWPDKLFPLADPLPPPAVSKEDEDSLNAALARIDNLSNLVEMALPAESAVPVPAVPLAAQPVADTREGWFVIRCVFERPNCGPINPPFLSDPTEPFQLAGFFDPDAPARPIRIALPVDTSPAGLRKFDKNAAFMISDILCGQIKRAKGLGLVDLVRSVLPWPLHKDLSLPDKGPCESGGTEIGMICSLSIPIITLCALILLMIIVSLLDIIFRWLPYFFICFPLPGFKGKKS